MAGRGAFIVFEGCDRAGKTTQCKRLVDALNKKNITAEFLNFPDRSTSIGKVINDYLTRKVDLPDKAVHLLFSANRWELEPQIRHKLHNGISLVVDRYSFSGAAFSGAKEGMNLSWCWAPEIGLPKPDAVFLLRLSNEALKQRGGFGNERYEVSNFQAEVWKNYKLMEDFSWKEIDAGKGEEELHHELLELFLQVHKESVDKPLSILEVSSQHSTALIDDRKNFS